MRTEQRYGCPFVICLHRERLSAQRGQVVGYIDHDKLNNTRSNLRIITQQENLQYRRRFCNNRSGFKGVTRQHGKIGRFVRPSFSDLSVNRLYRYANQTGYCLTPGILMLFNQVISAVLQIWG